MHGVHTGASAEAEDAVASMALDFVETCNESDVLASFLPSLRAVAAVSLARIALQVEPSWTPELAVTSQFSYEDVRPCIVAIVQYVGRGMFFFFFLLLKHLCPSPSASHRVSPRACLPLPSRLSMRPSLALLRPFALSLSSRLLGGDRSIVPAAEAPAHHMAPYVPPLQAMEDDDECDVSPQSMDSGFFSPTPSASTSFFGNTSAGAGPLSYGLQAGGSFTTMC